MYTSSYEAYNHLVSGKATKLSNYEILFGGWQKRSIKLYEEGEKRPWCAHLLKYFLKLKGYLLMIFCDILAVSPSHSKRLLEWNPLTTVMVRSLSFRQSPGCIVHLLKCWFSALAAYLIIWCPGNTQDPNYVFSLKLSSWFQCAAKIESHSPVYQSLPHAFSFLPSPFDGISWNPDQDLSPYLQGVLGIPHLLLNRNHPKILPSQPFTPHILQIRRWLGFCLPPVPHTKHFYL